MIPFLPNLMGTLPLPLWPLHRNHGPPARPYPLMPVVFVRCRCGVRLCAMRLAALANDSSHASIYTCCHQIEVPGRVYRFLTDSEYELDE